MIPGTLQDRALARRATALRSRAARGSGGRIDPAVAQHAAVIPLGALRSVGTSNALLPSHPAPGPPRGTTIAPRRPTSRGPGPARTQNSFDNPALVAGRRARPEAERRVVDLHDLSREVLWYDAECH